MLSAPTSIVDERGAPRFGAYAGRFSHVDLGALAGVWHRSRLHRLTHHKTWRWCMVASDEILVAFAIVDAGYAANGFVFAADLISRRLLVDRSALGLPGLSVHVGDRPNEGTRARFGAGGVALSISRPVGETAFRLTARAPDLSLDAQLEDGGGLMPLVLVAPVPGGTVNVTQKSAGLPARGIVRVGDHTYSLDGGFGGFDYTNGLLARRTAWRWAFATGRAEDGRIVAINLVQGFNESGAGSENVVWTDGTPVTVGRAGFAFDAAATTSPWRIATADGNVDLTFTPIGEHREERNLMVARSRFVQVAGTFQGTLDAGVGPIRVSGLPGVTEDQDVVW